jgi:iron(III) transport system permease protein
LSFLMTGRQWQLLGHTVLLGALVVLCTTLMGTSLGVVLAKTDIPYKGLLYSVLTVPLFLPPYLLGLSWFYLLGKNGLLASLAGAYVGEVSSSLLFSLSGTVFVLTLSYYPVTMMLVHTFVKAINPSFEEAGRLLMAWPKVLASIDLPLIAPGIYLGALLTFILTISELGVPLFLRYDVFTVQVFMQFAAFYDYKAASLFSLPLLLLIAALLMVERYTLRDRFFAVVGQKSQRQAVIPLGPLRLPAAGFVLAFMSIAVLLPIGALLIASRSPSFYLDAMRGSGQSIVNSLLYAGLGATLITILSFFLAYLIERSKGGRRHGVDTLLMLLFALPGTVLGIGLILLWNRPGTAFIYGSALVIVLGYVGRYTALAARIQSIAFRQIPESYQEAARLANVRWGTEILRIHVPSLHRPLLTS